MASFDNKKQLRFIITLGTGVFGTGGFDTITLEGYRSTANIDKAGGMLMGTLSAKIYGLSQSDMNSATTLQWQLGTYLPNTIEVFAIDGKSEVLVFAGNIVNAWGDYSGMPDVFLNIKAQSAYFNQLKAVAPLSISGGIDVSVVMTRIAKDMGLSFENNNVSKIIYNVYVASTLTEQARELAQMCGFDLYIDDKTLAITNRYSPRAGVVPRVAPDTGLIGYPFFDGICVNFQCLFNPAITFGGLVQLNSDLPSCSGEWVVVSVGYELSGEMPSSQWVCNVRGNQNGLAITK